MSVIVSLFDNATSTFEGVYTYENEPIAYTKLRRSVRNAFLNDEIDVDWIEEHCFIVVGKVDEHVDMNDVNAGTAHTIIGFNSVEWIYYPCIDFVGDLYGAGEEDDN